MIMLDNTDHQVLNLWSSCSLIVAVIKVQWEQNKLKNTYFFKFNFSFIVILILY